MCPDTSLNMQFSMCKQIEVLMPEDAVISELRTGDEVAVQQNGGHGFPRTPLTPSHTLIQVLTQEDCCQIWDEAKKHDRVSHLGSHFLRTTQELFHHLSNNTLSSKGKARIINFLHESGVIQMNVKTTMHCCNSETAQTDEKLMECQTERVEESHPTDESESRHVVSGFPQACSSSHSKQRNSIRYPNNNGEKLRIPDSNGATVQLRSQNSEVTQQKECRKTSLHIFNEATRLHASESRTSQLPVREEQATQLRTSDIRTPQLNGRRIRIPQMQESAEQAVTTDKNTDSVPLISEITLSGRLEGYANEVEGYANEVEEYANEVAEPQNYLNDSKTLLPRSCRSKQLQKNINKMKRMHSNKLELGNETNCARRIQDKPLQFDCTGEAHQTDRESQLKSCVVTSEQDDLGSHGDNANEALPGTQHGDSANDELPRIQHCDNANEVLPRIQNYYSVAEVSNAVFTNTLVAGSINSDNQSQERDHVDQSEHINASRIAIKTEEADDLMVAVNSPASEVEKNTSAGDDVRFLESVTCRSSTSLEAARRQSVPNCSQFAVEETATHGYTAIGQRSKEKIVNPNSDIPVSHPSPGAREETAGIGENIVILHQQERDVQTREGGHVRRQPNKPDEGEVYVYNTSAVRMYQCEHCGKRLDSRRSLALHRTIHTENPIRMAKSKSFMKTSRHSRTGNPGRQGESNQYGNTRRSSRYYTPVSMLSPAALERRRDEIRERVRKHRERKKIGTSEERYLQQGVPENSQSWSVYLSNLAQ